MGGYNTGVTTNGLRNFTIEGETGDEQPVMRFSTDEQNVAVSSSLIHRERIVVDRDVLGGEPHVRGTRIPAAAVLDGLAEGLAYEELMEHFPRLTREDIRAALEFAAEHAVTS
jgi:uncharacterized protein (DUF433 family)